jgi:2-iminobutanoate/2-iminopropanoate deaminase
VRAGEFLFVTGQLGVDPKTGKVVPGGTAEQMRQVMRNLEVVLRGSNATFDNVTMARIFLVNFVPDYPEVNKIYAEYFKPGRYPARTTVGVTALALGCTVEVDLIARL